MQLRRRIETCGDLDELFNLLVSTHMLEYVPKLWK